MLAFTKLEPIEELDDLLYQNEQCFYFSERDIASIQEKFIVSAFQFHYESCSMYRNYCVRRGVRIGDITRKSDFDKIPLIPSTLFKNFTILSCEKENVVKRCTSSGTKGSISSVYRDEDTLNRFLGSIQVTIDQLLNIDDAFCINLGPSTEEAGDLWFSYAISNLDLLFPTDNFVLADRFYPDRALEGILRRKELHEHLVIIGAPIMFLELIEFMKESKVKVESCENVLFLTAGGWKRFSGRAIGREPFMQAVGEVFLGTQSCNFRDILNMVELNTVIPECQHHVKHVAPWLSVSIINPETMRSAPDGDVGLLAYLDPTTTSYPCFILTDDLGRIVKRDDCPCGRKGVGMEYVRRIKSPDSRGCALKIDKHYAHRVSEGAARND